ncbi:MAG: PHP domain-containing protein [Deltaproteobacteria bacterium]|nr:PHP domain-containing protein [Deltaproteobacteria bacterium]
MRRWFVVGLCTLSITHLEHSSATPKAATKARPRVVFDMKPGKTGPLAYEIVDHATGKRMPAKLTFVGVKGTAHPRFSKNDIGREEADATGVASFNRVYSVDGRGEIPLPLGTYDITVSRGIEWTISTQRLEMTAAGAKLGAKLEHVIETPKWASGDFHVHADPSPDSNVPMRDRVFEFVAEGIDMIVATDHNIVADYAPHIASLELGRQLSSTPGDEVSTGWGHFGAFPLPPKAQLPKLSRLKPQQVFDAFRMIGKDAVINVHHPRLEKLTGYFWIGKLDAKTGTAKRKDFSFDFDAIELLNGYEDTSKKKLDANMADWFALLDRGVLATATGNSDTHHMTYNLGGYPRNYVQVDDDAPGTVTGADMAKGIKARRAFFTTAPIVSFTSGSAGIGDIAAAPGGNAKVEILVRAAPWVAVDRVKLYVGGKLVKTWQVSSTGDRAIERLKTTYDLDLEGDTHAVIRVEGDEPLTPVVGGIGSINIYPLAVTNPILFDVDGNKAYDAPRR